MSLEISRPADYRAALYIRLSREDEGEGPSQSVQNQESMLREFARRQGLTACTAYVDDGCSGTTFDRPAFCRMLADIEAGRINMVITKDLSRLGRDYILTGHYMERYFPEHRVRYLSLLDGIDTGVDSSANDITPFRAILNDLYARDISRKIRSVKRDKQRRGQFIGGKPVYGYRMHPTEKNRIVVDEGAAPVVRRIFALALSGVSCREIARQLNGEGVPAPALYAGLPLSPGYSGLWSGERISEMLRNETYLGNMVQGRSVKVSYKSKQCRRQDREDWIVVEGTHCPLVDRNTFQEVQRQLASRRHTRSRTYDFLLKGLVYCKECGRPLGVIRRSNARGEDVLYHICRTYQRCAGDCTSHTLREDAVREAVAEQVRQICTVAAGDDRLVRAAREELTRRAGRQGERADLERALSRLQWELDRTYGDRLVGLLGEEDFRRIYGRLKGERERLEQRLVQEEARRAQPAEHRAEDLVRRFFTEGLMSRGTLVRLVERVELSEEGEAILRFRFRAPRTDR